jgi:branched-chain amino acid transport system permease protein
MQNSVKKNRLPYLLVGLVLAGLLIAPLFFGNQYLLHVMIRIFVVSLSVLGVRLILISGSVSLGQAAFAAVGAYASAVLTMKLGMSTWLALPFAGLIAALVGAAIGWPALRLRGIYFIILTLCISGAIMHYIANLGWLTGGLKGLYGIPAPASIVIAGHTIVDFSIGKAGYYYYGLALLAFCFWIMVRIDRSRLGVILRAVAQSEPLAASVGVPVMRYKVLAFSIACFFCGVAGAFHAHYSLFLQTSSFGAWDSIYYLVYVIVGGAGSVIGPVAGCAIMLGSFEILRPLAKFQPIVYGGILMAIVLLIPDGLTSVRNKLNDPFNKCLGMIQTKCRSDSQNKDQVL